MNAHRIHTTPGRDGHVLTGIAKGWGQREGVGLIFIVLFDNEQQAREVPVTRVQGYGAVLRALQAEHPAADNTEADSKPKPTYAELEQRVKTLEARITELEAMVNSKQAA